MEHYYNQLLPGSGSWGNPTSEEGEGSSQFFQDFYRDNINGSYDASLSSFALNLPPHYPHVDNVDGIWLANGTHHANLFSTGEPRYEVLDHARSQTLYGLPAATESGPSIPYADWIAQRPQGNTSGSTVRASSPHPFQPDAAGLFDLVPRPSLTATYTAATPPPNESSRNVMPIPSTPSRKKGKQRAEPEVPRRRARKRPHESTRQGTEASASSGTSHVALNASPVGPSSYGQDLPDCFAPSVWSPPDSFVPGPAAAPYSIYDARLPELHEPLLFSNPLQDASRSCWIDSADDLTAILQSMSNTPPPETGPLLQSDSLMQTESSIIAHSLSPEVIDAAIAELNRFLANAQTSPIPPTELLFSPVDAQLGSLSRIGSSASPQEFASSSPVGAAATPRASEDPTECVPQFTPKHDHFSKASPLGGPDHAFSASPPAATGTTRKRKLRDGDAPSLGKARAKRPRTRKNKAAAQIDGTAVAATPVASRSNVYADEDVPPAPVRKGKPKTAEPDGPFPCPFPGCFQSLGRKFDLTRHLDTHNPPRVQCDECGKKLSRKDSLTRHLKRHGNKSVSPAS